MSDRGLAKSSPATRRQALGKGLDALLPDVSAVAQPPDASVDAPRELPLERLSRWRGQPRRNIPEDGIDELARSIRAQGVIEPVIVRRRPDGDYQIIAGERRWRAAQRAGLETVPVIVRDVDDKAALALALIENLQREDLRPLEEAAALQRLRDEHALTHEQLAEAVGRSRSAVTNALRLLKLAPGVRERLDDGTLEMGHARALLPLSDAAQETAAREVARGALSVRQTEALVKRMLNPPAPPPRCPDTSDLERNLSEHVGAPVTIAAAKGGKGRIVIRYATLDELDGILARIGARVDEGA